MASLEVGNPPQANSIKKDSLLKFNNILHEKIDDITHSFQNVPKEDWVDYLSYAETALSGDDYAYDDLLRMYLKHQKLRQTLQKELHTEYGARVTLWRGIALEEDKFEKHLHSASMGETKILKSYSGKTIFSWTNDYKVAEEFASDSNKWTWKEIYDGYGIIFEASIPTNMILFAAPLFDLENLEDSIEVAEDMDISAFRNYLEEQSEFIVWHRNPVKAKVVSFERYEYGD